MKFGTKRASGAYRHRPTVGNPDFIYDDGV
jgi:hypothetical protein